MKQTAVLLMIAGAGLACGEPVSFYSDKPANETPRTVAPQVARPVQQLATPSPTISDIKAHTSTGGPAAGSDRVRGIITETMDASGYTYAAVQTDDKKSVWTAGPQTALKLGTVVDLKSSTVMHNFNSKTLNRTFDRILFVSSFGNVGGAPSPHPAYAAAHSTPNASKSSQAPTTKSSLGSASTDAQSGLHTVAALHTNPALSGREVLVKGKVVKFNAGIMGKNWLHLQDGTGNAAQKTNDLTVTTQATVTVGSIITVRAKVSTNKDFGAGYSYPVILEDAAVVATQ